MSAQQIAGASSDQPIAVLLVEDSPSDADLLQSALHGTGVGHFQFTWVERLEDALGLLRRQSFDVLLLDLSLPDSSGPDTFRRAHSAAPRLPVVVLTGVQDESLGLAAVHEGIQDYLVKGQSDGRQIARAIRYAIERKRAEEELGRQARLKDEFLALLGHELRNPLAAISTAMQLLSNGVTAPRRASLMELTGRQVAVLRRLVDDLLDLARIAHGKIELNKERIDLSKLLQSAAAAAQSAAAARGQEMVLRMPSEQVVFMADAVRLEQVVTNLMSNASKYTARGGRIELSGAREGSEVVVRCKDNGRGIPPEMQTLIFEPFTRVERAGQSPEEGVGIGLAVVKRLVELHGGTVSVESGGAGTGSEFTVRLPLVHPPPASRAEPEIAPVPRIVSTLPIVVVEDNPDVAQTMTIALEQAGYSVQLFTDGPSALSGMARLEPAAVLLDIGLPGMDGYALAANLRRKRHLRDTLFVGLSGFKRRAQEEKARDDFDHYFVKPLDLNELLKLLNERAGLKKAGADKARRTPKGLKPFRVLLIEDHVQLAEVTAEMLRQEGLEVKVAHSGREALDAAPDFQPQLTLCDLHLPDMPGGEVVQALRANPSTRRTHAVILTASSTTEILALRGHAKAVGVDRFLPKPLTPEVLRELLVKLRPAIAHERPQRGIL